MSISQPGISQIALGLQIAGMAVSLLLRIILANAPAIRVDSLLYSFAMIAAVFATPALNGLLPEGGFPREVLPAAVLTWMVVFGSFFNWRDGTLLFQAIPSIALFGLAGVYDTYRLTPYMFFGFLLCLATMFARSQTREMMRQAVQSGYFNRPEAPNAPTDFPEESEELFEDIKKGPWRWQAGPQWALASALGVVLLSFLGAPVLQVTFKSLSGTIPFVAPRINRPNPTPSSNGGQFENMATVSVGRGPNKSLSDKRAIYTANLDKARYLRTATYDSYVRRGWTNSPSSQSADITDFINSANAAAIDEMADHTEYKFTIRPLQPTKLLPTPIETIQTNNEGLVIKKSDGAYEMNNLVSTEIEGTAWENTTSQPVNAPTTLVKQILTTKSIANVSRKVIDLAREITKGAKTDFQKAQIIKAEISNRCKYNLNAAATPPSEDPVEFFLFSSHEGYCDLFASSMVTMARAAGMPARYVQGFLPESNNSDSQGNYVIMESDYHAWAEIFFKDVGWVVFDATDGAEEVPGSGRGASTDHLPFYQQDWFKTLINCLIGISVILLAYFAYRYLEPKSKAKPQLSDTEKSYLAFSKMLYKATGRRRRPSETPHEYIAALSPELGDGLYLASEINERLVQNLYSATPTSVDTIRTSEDIKLLRILLKQQAKKKPS